MWGKRKWLIPCNLTVGKSRITRYCLSSVWGGIVSRNCVDLAKGLTKPWYQLIVTWASSYLPDNQTKGYDMRVDREDKIMSLELRSTNEGVRIQLMSGSQLQAYLATFLFLYVASTKHGSPKEPSKKALLIVETFWRWLYYNLCRSIESWSLSFPELDNHFSFRWYPKKRNK